MFYLRLRQHSVNRVTLVCLIAVIAVFVAGCNSTKYLQNDEFLYQGAELVFTDTSFTGVDTNALRSDLLDLSRQDPNEKVLGLFPIKTWLYTLGDTAIDHYIAYQEQYDTRFLFVFDYDTLLKFITPLSDPKSNFREWLTTKAEEAPVLIDSTIADETAVRMSNYLYNRGFFEGTAVAGYRYDKKRQTGKVIYEVDAGKLYRMRNVYYEIADKGLLNKINQIPQKSSLAPGEPIDVDLLKAERTRINDYLRNVGYYRFQKEYIYFEVDTASGFDSLDIYVRVSNPVSDTVHHPFRIRNIYVYPNASIDYVDGVTPTNTFHYTDSTKVSRPSKKKLIAQYASRDTTLASASMYSDYLKGKVNKKDALKYYINKDSSSRKYYTLTAAGDLQPVKLYKTRTDYYLINSLDNYSPKAIADNIFINPNGYYSDSLIQRTVASFSSVGVFKYITVQALEIWDSTSYQQSIDLIVRLDPLQIRTVSYEFNANTTSDYLLGNAINFGYNQKNLFHRMDQLKLSLKGGIETQLGGDVTYINTSELNAGLSLTLPEFMWPIPIQVPKRYFPKTDWRVNFNYIDQINDFTLFNTTIEYNVSIYENSKNDRAQKQHIFKMPIPTLNIVRVPNISDAFREELNANPLLRQSFEEQLILGYGYTLILNTQPTGKHVLDYYLRTSAEFNTPFSDFIKVDADFRTYLNINTSNNIVFRATSGVAIPLAGKNPDAMFNTEVIPYVKQFFTGGAYSVRAFTVRKLGPGAYVDYDTTNFQRVDQVADIKLEANLEYRFDIISMLEGAVFCDIGNTFTLKDDPFRPHAQFHFTDFYKLLAVGPGAGLRLDFGYFVIRVDAAYPLYDPALDGPYREEVLGAYEAAGYTVPSKKVAINLAIGYPF